MYAHFYQLSEDPFNLTPDPKFHYVNESTREALASILYGIRSRKGFVTLIGEAGTGKTTLLKRVVDEIEGETRVVFVFNPGVSFDELLEYICIELGISAQGSKRLTLMEKLNAFLLEQLTEGRNVVVMIDEAQTVDDAVLEDLRLLSNLETAKEKIIQIVLSGQPELDEKLRRPSLRQLRQRIGVRATLSAMPADEIKAYIETRLRGAGSPRGDLFTPGALSRVWSAAQGIPRVINVICDNAMMIAFAEGREKVTSRVVASAISDLHGDSFQAGFTDRMRRWIAIPAVRYAGVAAAVGAVLLGGFLLWPGGGEDTVQLAANPSPTAATPDERRKKELVRGVRRQANAERRLKATAPVPAPAPVAVPASPAQPVVSVVEGVPDALGTDAVLPERAPVRSGEVLVGQPGLGSTRGAEEAPERSGNSDLVEDSMRRAELIAGSTAARLFAEDESPNGQVAVLEPEARAPRLAPTDSAPPGVVSEGPVEGLEDIPQVKTRPMEDAAAMAAQIFAPAPEPEPEPAPVARKPDVLGGAVASDASAGDEAAYAGDLEALASLSRDAAGTAPGAGRPATVSRPGGAIVGRLVSVARGDTVWAIAMQYYGTVDSDVLTQIFRNNAAIVDPDHLEIGSQVYLPFSSPEQMVQPGVDGSYRVLVAEGPDRTTVDRAASWLRASLPGVALSSETKGRGKPVQMLYAVGFASKALALEQAREVLARYGEARGRQTRTGRLVATSAAG